MEMETDNKRPTAALINKGWYEAAKPLLTNEGLGRVIMAACEYIFTGNDAFLNGPIEKAVFAMIKPALDSDIDKYVERCARNAANARGGWQRVAASGSDSVPVAANTTTTSTTKTTTTSTRDKSLSIDEVRERERFIIYGHFWSTGSKAVAQESNAFWDYYEALGWKNNKGAPIVNKLACARQWHPQFETGTAPDGAPVWFRVCRECPVPDINVFRAYAGAERTTAGVVVRLRCTAQFLADLKNTMPELEKALQRAWKAPQIDFECIQ